MSENNAYKAEHLPDEVLVERLYAMAFEPGHDAECDALAAIITSRLVETYGSDDGPAPRARIAD